MRPMWVVVGGGVTGKGQPACSIQGAVKAFAQVPPYRSVLLRLDSNQRPPDHRHRGLTF